MNVLPGEEFLRFFEAGGRQGLVTLMRFKQALTKELALPEAFSAYRQAVDYPDTDHLQLKQIKSLRETAKNGHGAFVEVAPAGERFVIDPPIVIGEGNHRPIEGVARSIFVACLLNARIRGRSALIEVDGVPLLDREDWEWARTNDQLDFDPAVFNATDKAAWIIEPTSGAASLELDEAFTLLGVHTYAFGHWIWEYLPKYIAAVLSGALPSIPVLIDAGMPRTHRQALELMIPQGVEIIELPAFVTAHVHRLWCAPSQMHIGLLEKVYDEPFKWDYLAAPPARFATVIREMVRRADRIVVPPTGCERVFLARKPFRHAKLVNHERIEAAARARGFVVIYPEDLEFAEQVRMVRQARFIVGPDGSSMFLAFFARPGTKLCVLSHPYTISEPPQRSGLLRELGIDVTLLTGPFRQVNDMIPDHSEFEINEEVFSRFLGRWLETEVRNVPSAQDNLPAWVTTELTRFKQALSASGWYLFELMIFKRALTERLGIQEGFDAYQHAITLPDSDFGRPKPVTGGDQIRLKRIESLRDAARRSEVFVEIGRGGEPFVIAPPSVIGIGNHRTVVGLSRSIFLTCLSEAVVRGDSVFIDLENAAVLDYQGQELVNFNDQLDYDPAVFRATHEAAWMITPEDTSSSLQLDEAFMLLGVRAGAFGHWMWEYLPQYIAASLSGALPPVPILVDAGMPRTHRQALEVMLPDGVQIIELARFATARVRRLWRAARQVYVELHSGDRPENFKWECLAAPPARFALIIREMARRAHRVASAPTGCERVFLARHEFRNNALINHKAIEAAAVERGFLVIYPEDLEFAEQVRFVSQAKVVVGPIGSSLYLTFFLRPGAKLCALSNPFTLAYMTFLTGYLNEIGIEVVMLTGPFAHKQETDPNHSPHHSDFQIDEKEFCLFLDRWLQTKSV